MQHLASVEKLMVWRLVASSTVEHASPEVGNLPYSTSFRAASSVCNNGDLRRGYGPGAHSRLDRGLSTCVPSVQLDAPEDGSDGEGGSSRGVDAVKLLSAVLADSPSNRQAMLQMAGAHGGLCHMLLATVRYGCNADPCLHPPLDPNLSALFGHHMTAAAPPLPTYHCGCMGLASRESSCCRHGA